MKKFKRVKCVAQIGLLMVQAFILCLPSSPAPACTAAARRERAVKEENRRQKETEITISAAGDCTLGSDQSSPSSVNFYAVKRKKAPDYFFKKPESVSLALNYFHNAA